MNSRGRTPTKSQKRRSLFGCARPPRIPDHVEYDGSSLLGLPGRFREEQTAQHSSMHPSEMSRERNDSGITHVLRDLAGPSRSQTMPPVDDMLALVNDRASADATVGKDQPPSYASLFGQRP